ncbi:MAG: PP2C family protein-serine/threonine phosphatase [Planctomycetota bacterium]
MPCAPEDAARLIEACRDLVSGGTVDDVLDLAALRTTELLSAETVRVLCAAEDGSGLRVERVATAGGVRRTSEPVIPFGRGLTGLAFSGDNGARSDDLAGDDRADPEADSLPAGSAGSMTAAPLVFDGRTAGVITAFSPRPGALGADHLDLLLRFAELAGAALHGARMHRREIEAERARHELAVAADIQKNLLPAELPDTGTFDFEAVCLPAEEVGGDLYDIFPFPDGRLCAVLGDVSGKGVPAALYMTWMVAELRLLAEHSDDLGKMMAELNDRLCARSTRGMFVTLMAGLFSPQSGNIEVASAGHHPPLLRRADGFVEEVPYPSAPPLGIRTAQNYPTACFHLAPGEAALGFTDGVVEARNAGGDEFGLERLKKVLAKGGGRGTLRRVLRSLARFTGGSPQRDDTTMVLIWRKEG